MTRQARLQLAVALIGAMAFSTFVALRVFRTLMDRADTRRVEREAVQHFPILAFMPLEAQDVEVWEQIDTNEIWGCFRFAEWNPSSLEVSVPPESSVLALPEGVCDNAAGSLPRDFSKHGYELRHALATGQVAVVAVSVDRKQAVFWTTAR